ncbi:MAG TPA: cation:proton antiporter, partial [Alphaproteobacteria bacterium]|nr:cation:proton antiporter [Alphaproteobacteria bacterium]
MTLFQILAALLFLTAVSGYLNHKFLRLPPTIGNMAFAFLLSLLAILLDKAEAFDLSALSAFVRQIDFSQILLHGMLAFLLFAGALHIKLEELKDVKWSVATLATSGVVIAAFVTGTLAWLVAPYLGLHLPYLYALLFGALISPTDPIAVLSILKDAG